MITTPCPRECNQRYAPRLPPVCRHHFKRAPHARKKVPFLSLGHVSSPSGGCLNRLDMYLSQVCHINVASEIFARSDLYAFLAPEHSLGQLGYLSASLIIRATPLAVNQRRANDGSLNFRLVLNARDQNDFVHEPMQSDVWERGDFPNAFPIIESLGIQFAVNFSVCISGGQDAGARSVYQITRFFFGTMADARHKSSSSFYMICTGKICRRVQIRVDQRDLRFYVLSTTSTFLASTSKIPLSSSPPYRSRTLAY